MTPHVEFERARLRLRLGAPVRFRAPNHGAVLSGLVRAALGPHELPPGLLPFACESGRMDFAAGDEYAFALTLAGAAAGLLDGLAAGLEAVGRSAPAGDAPFPTLGGNFDVVAVDRLPRADLAAQIVTLSGMDTVTIRFVSPLDSEDCTKGSTFQVGYFLERLFLRPFDVLGLKRPSSRDRAAAFPCPPAGTVHDFDLVWMDVPAKGRPRTEHDRQSRPDGYRLGGYQGRVRVGGIPPEWHPWLVLGQYLHVGSGVHFGCGRFIVEECGAASRMGLAPSQSALDRLADPVRLAGALAHLRARRTARPRASRVPATADGLARLVADRSAEVAVPDEEPSTPSMVDELADSIRTGRYVPGPLHGFTIEKPDGRLRPLAVPGLRDRVLQRAACELLTPTVEAVLEESSHAYRRGRSRFTAADAVADAVRDGYRWVLDADITSFFDSVDWARLFGQLRALFPFEPLIALIEAWVRAPVDFHGLKVERARGLPQGMPLSPLLANLFLDQFDEALQQEDFRLVRFADDFLVLCKSVESAERARAASRAALEGMGLSLSDEKTSVRSVDAGFTYLGLLFCGSIVTESAGGRPATLRPADAVPPASWLAQVPLANIVELSRSPRQERSERRPEVVPLHQPADGRTRAVPVFVGNVETRLFWRHGLVVIEEPGRPRRELPAREVSHLTLCGPVRATVPLVATLAEHGVPVYFCKRNGELTGTLTGHEPDAELWLTQARVAADPTFVLETARAIVAVKLHNQAATLVRFRISGGADTPAAIRKVAYSSSASRTPDELRGYEGRGAALYFAAIAEHVPPEWEFRGRARRPAPDPMNALLGLGYTIMHRHCATALTAAGLHAGIGLFHRGHGQLALASDLVEEFRHLVDRWALAQIHRGELHRQDFAVTFGDRGPECLLVPDARARAMARLGDRLAESCTRDGDTRSYREWIDVQAGRLRQTIRGVSDAYLPFRER